MKFRHILFSVGMIIPAMTVHAQYVEDALRFSQTNTFGSARFQGMGGVNTALGADISSISGNPAGLGFFRKSEWSLSPALTFANTQADYKPYPNASVTGNRDGKVNFNIANMGIVFASPKSNIKGGAWRGGSFGISFTRLNSFQNLFTYKGVNDQSSFTDYLADQAYRYTESQLNAADNQIGFDVPERQARAQLGYLAYLIDPIFNNEGEPTLEYRSGAGSKQRPRTSQQETVATTGAHNQWNASYGGNIADKFYFGASIGLSSLRYGYEKRFSETILETDFPGLLNFTYTDNYEVAGSGINGTLGFIYKPNDIIRFGVSATTPTYYWNLREEFSSSVSANFDNIELENGTILNRENYRTVTNNYDYRLSTPFRLSGGLAVFAGKRGFFTADAEFVNYNGARLSSSDGGFDQDNASIQNNYQPAINFRVGGEFREGIFRARLGGAYFGDPYDQKQGDDLNRSRINLTGGVGLRLPNFYIDLAVVHSRFKSGYSPYTFQNDHYFVQNYSAPSTTIRNANTNAVISFGTFF